MINPYYNKNNIAVTFSSDNNYIPILAIAIKSIIENATSENNYDIVILNAGIDECYQKRVKALADDYKNINIRFYDINYILEKYDESLFYTSMHFSKAAYYRLFIPEIFMNFEKVLYLDCDVVSNVDVKKLFDIDMKGKSALAAKDIGIQIALKGRKKYKDKFVCDYIKANILELKNWDNYFQSAVMVFDINKIKDKNFVDNAIYELKRVKTPCFVEQCILNIVYENDIKFLDWYWNFNVTHYNWSIKALRFRLKLLLELIFSNINPLILHYTFKKPYNYLKIEKHHKPFWKYAKMIDFYAEIEKKQLLVIKNNDILKANLSLWEKIERTIKILKEYKNL